MNKALYTALKSLTPEQRRELNAQERNRLKGVKVYEPFQLPQKEVGKYKKGPDKGKPILITYKAQTHKTGRKITLKFEKGDRTYEVQHGGSLKRV